MTTFATNNKKVLFESIDRYLERQGSFTKARYLKMCALQKIEPKISEMPIDIEDFPQIVRDALEVYNRLPDTYTSTDLGPLFTGKNYTSIPVFYEYVSVTDVSDRNLILEIVQHLDSKAVTREVQKFKRAADKIKSKNRAKRS